MTLRVLNAEGKLTFQVVRYEPKQFRQRRPDPDNQGEWIWNLKGVERVLFRLPEFKEALAKEESVYVCEGEKDVLALEYIGLSATCNAGGAGKWEPQYTDSLAGADVVVIADKDEPGRKHGELVGSALSGVARSVRVIELPDRDGKPVKDAADWVSAGGTAVELKSLVDKARPFTPSSAPTSKRPLVLLPRSSQSISETGRHLGELLAETKRFFLRGGSVVRLRKDHEGFPVLDDAKPVALASDFETVATLHTMSSKGDIAPAICNESQAKLITASEAFRSALPPIRVVARCPMLIERNGTLIEVCGYDRESGILASGSPTVQMSPDVAVSLLDEMLAEFSFTTPGDRARSLAALITPALVLGGLLPGRAPLDLGEATASQSGKGYRNKLTAALYAESVRTITQSKGGVGAMEETFSQALLNGANFLCLDNVRGKIDSPAIESFLTEDRFLARAPYRQPTEVDPKRVMVMLTSNKADLTTDLSNRSSIVHIRKQPDGHSFKRYPEGGILDHVRANQPQYLGAVFSIIRTWHEAGKPRTEETRHDFREWVQTLDWITRNLLNAGPLMDGHSEAQTRVTTPSLNWLRDLALEVIKAGRDDRWMRTNELLDLLEDADIAIPGTDKSGDLSGEAARKAALQATGRTLAKCFRSSEGEAVMVDQIQVERRQQRDTFARKLINEYRFSTAPERSAPIGANHPSIGARSENHNVTSSESLSKSLANQNCAYTAPKPAPDLAPIKPLHAPNAPDTNENFQKKRQTSSKASQNRYSIDINAALRRIRSIRRDPEEEVELEPSLT